MNAFPSLDQHRILGARIIVTRYERPETWGSLYLPPAWRIDNSCSIWEPLKWSGKAEEVLGVKLSHNCLLLTKPFRGVYVGTLDGRDIFYLDAEHVESIRWYDDC